MVTSARCATRREELLMLAVAIQGRDDRVSIGAVRETTISQLLMAARTSSSRSMRPTASQPRSPARRQVRFGQGGEGDDRRVGIQAGNRLDRPGKREVSMHLVGKQRDVVIVGEFEQSAANLGGIAGARGVVRIDYHQGQGRRCDQSADLLDVGSQPSSGAVL